ncbi:glycosyltransferase family 8 C-terminal domain-containing protein, partial [Escherichia sp. TWPC-MK]
CQKYFNEAYQASCWNDVAFIPATNEKQYQVKYQHAKKNGDISLDTAFHYVGVTKPWNDWTNYPCQKYFNEAYQASCWNDVAFIPATNE